MLGNAAHRRLHDCAHVRRQSGKQRFDKPVSHIVVLRRVRNRLSRRNTMARQYRQRRASHRPVDTLKLLMQRRNQRSNASDG